MPPAFLAGVGGFVGLTGTAAIVGGAVIIGVAVVGTVVALQAIAEARSISPGLHQPGALINRNSSEASIPIVYGYRRVGATRIFLRSAGANGEKDSEEYLHIVFAVAEGEIDRFDRILFGENLVYRQDADVIGYPNAPTTDNPDTGERGVRRRVGFNDHGIATASGPDGTNYGGLVEISRIRGAHDQAALQTLVDRFPDEWTAAHRGRGIAYCYIRFRFDRDALASVPTVTFEIRGREIRPRRAATAAAYMAGTPVFSDNPADVIADYLVDRVYGRGLDPSLLDWNSFREARAYFDEPHDFLADVSFIRLGNIPLRVLVPGASGGTPLVLRFGIGQKLFTLNGVVSAENSLFDNIKTLLANCNSELIYINGLYRLVPYKAETPVATITENDIVAGEWSLDLGSKQRIWNTFRVRFANEQEGFQPAQAIIEDRDLIAEDNGTVLQKEISLDLVTNPDRARLIAYRLLRQSRQQAVITMSLPHTFQFLEPMNVVSVDLPYIPDSQPMLFRIVEITLVSDGTLKVRGEQYADSVYDDVDPVSLRQGAIVPPPVREPDDPAP